MAPDNFHARPVASLFLISKAAGLGVVVLLLALLCTLAACSPGREQGTQRSGEDVRVETVPLETTAVPERTTGNEGETTAPTVAPSSWDYVALGDSLAVGVGAHQGYVDRYAEYLRSDTGARIEVVNLGQSGQTSSQLLFALRNDPSMRRTLRGAEVVTFNIGINDLGQASRAYENGTCGGLDNEECLREAVQVLEENWDATIGEILSLRGTQATIIRSAGLGYTPRVDGVFEPYLAEVNRHIASSVAGEDILHAEVRLGNEGMSPDGLHPNDEGYAVIADRLRELGYEPLNPR